MAHSAVHSKLVVTVSDFKKEFGAGNAMISIEITNFLRDWLLIQILKTEKKFAKTLDAACAK